jgi:DNA processing protein
MGTAHAGVTADEAALGLAFLSQYGCCSLLRLVEREGPEAVWQASRRRLLDWGLVASAVERFEEKRRRFEVEEVRALLTRTGLRFLAYGTTYYPQELAHLRHPPAGLFARGDEAALTRLRSVPRIAIVGTRRATPYGLRVTDRFASAFAEANVAVVSGMALGIDGRAHEAALAAGGLTVAVLGCGADVVYPRRHRGLYESIGTNGVILSELPPGTPPARWTFPHRNRLLAALADAVLVIEGSLTSGALQTAGWGLDLGRPVFAVPGPIAVDRHEGCNRLLYEGAGPAIDPCATVEDFLQQTRIERKERLEATCSGRGGVVGETLLAGGGCSAAEDGRRLSGGFSGALREACPIVGSHVGRILEALDQGACSVDSLVGHTGLAVRQLTAALAELELAGLVTRGGPGMYIRAP